MAKTDWGLNDIVRPQDMNDIGGEINQLRTDVDNIEVPPASLTQAGIVQLSNVTDGVSESKAATEKALGLVMAEAQAGKQAGIERKNEVVAALNSIGVAASTSESWESLITKMAAIIKATGNAVAADVLNGKTFSNAGSNNLTGTMPNRGAGGNVTPGTTNQTKAAGYYSSAITILGEPNLIAANLPKDKTFWGIVGTLERMTTAEKQAIANAITAKGVPASVNDSNTVLAQKIGQIEVKNEILLNYQKYIVNSTVGVTETVFTLPPGSLKFSYVPTKPNDSYIFAGTNHAAYLKLVDASNNEFNVFISSAGRSKYILKMDYDAITRTIVTTWMFLGDNNFQYDSIPVPANFNVNGSIRMINQMVMGASTGANEVTLIGKLYVN